MRSYSGRQNDRIGFAIAHAIIGDTAADAFGLHRAETSFELTYQAILGRNFVVQPNFAFVHHPAGATRAPNSLGVGLRFVFVTAYPIKMEASDPGDPTIPPDGSLVPSD
jgi:carbohydrate-selective porin OprB